MQAGELAKRLGLEVAAGEAALDNELNGCYICDLLSYVMSHASQGNVWITVQTNINVVAVAVLTEVGCVIVPENIAIDALTREKAQEENVVLLRSSMSAYELALRIHECLQPSHGG